MSHHGKRFLAPATVLCVLVVTCVLARSSGMSAAPAGNRVIVQLTLDPATNKVTASPDPAALHYSNGDYADWQVAPASAPFDFTIGFEDQTKPGKRKPAQKLPSPGCSGTGRGKHCSSIVPTAAHKGDQKYSVTVQTASGPVKTDPEVSIDP